MPKTGGSWATEAMLAAGVPWARPEGPPGHATLQESWEYGDRFTFAFVRHPLDYWRSYWAFRVRTGWEMNHPLDRDFGTDNFEEFIEAVILHSPGAASELYERFVGPPDDEISFIGRYEHLVDDVCFALRLGGESFDEQALRAYPKVNVSDYGIAGGRYPRSLALRLAEAEQSGIERFYAWDPTPAELIIDGVSPQLRSVRQTADLTIRLRNALAERDIARTSRADLELALAETQRSLEVIQNSRLQRWSFGLRRLWYRYRTPIRVHGRPSGLSASSS